MIGDFIFAEYSNGSMYNGEIVNIRKMDNGETLFTIFDTIRNQYRSLYVSDCTTYKLFPKSN